MSNVGLGEADALAPPTIAAVAPAAPSRNSRLFIRLVRFLLRLMGSIEQVIRALAKNSISGPMFLLLRRAYGRTWQRTERGRTLLSRDWWRQGVDFACVPRMVTDSPGPESQALHARAAGTIRGLSSQVKL